MVEGLEGAERHAQKVQDHKNGLLKTKMNTYTIFIPFVGN
jgi:hypothetical protein